MINANKFLSELGWSENYISIFLALHSYGEQTVLQLSRNTKIPRSSLYLELDEMADAGFVTIRKEGKRTFYNSIPVDSIKNILLSRQQKLNKLFEGFDDFVETLKDGEVRYKSKYEMTIYKGQEGVKQLLWNILTSSAKEVDGFSPGTLEHVVDRDFAEEWRLEFKSRGKHNRIIVNKKVPLDWSNIPDFLTDRYVEVRTLEEKKIAFAHEVWFYGDIIVLISTKDDPEQYGIEITDRLLVSSYKQLFNLIWNELAEKV